MVALLNAGGYLQAMSSTHCLRPMGPALFLDRSAGWSGRVSRAGILEASRSLYRAASGGLILSDTNDVNGGWLRLALELEPA